MASQKRAQYPVGWLPYALVAPQLAITIVFFFWPASQALWQSLLVQDVFGANVQFVGLLNFRELFADPYYLDSFWVTGEFALLVTGSALVVSLVLAACCDYLIRGTRGYKMLLVWPYAVAPALAAVLWAFIFSPGVGIITYVLKHWFGYDWNYLLNGGQALTLVVIASAWKQISYNFLFFLSGHAGDSRNRSSRRRRSTARGRSGASPPSCSRCSRRPPSSCWWSTSSTPSSRASA